MSWMTTVSLGPRLMFDKESSVLKRSSSIETYLHFNLPHPAFPLVSIKTSASTASASKTPCKFTSCPSLPKLINVIYYYFIALII